MCSVKKNNWCVIWILWSFLHNFLFMSFVIANILMVQAVESLFFDGKQQSILGDQMLRLCCIGFEI